MKAYISSFIASVAIILFTIPSISAHAIVEINHVAQWTFADDTVKLRYELLPNIIVLDETIRRLDISKNGVLEYSEAEKYVNDSVIPNITVDNNDNRLQFSLLQITLAEKSTYQTGSSVIIVDLEANLISLKEKNYFNAHVLPSLGFEHEITQYESVVAPQSAISLGDTSTDIETGTFYRLLYTKESQTVIQPVSESKNPLDILKDLSENLLAAVAKAFSAQDAGLILVAILLAFLSGAIHSLTPGHGKSIITAYLIGTRRSELSDLFLLGTSLTLSHTLLIYFLGFILLFFSNFFTINQLLPYFTGLSTIILLGIGIHLLRQSYVQFKNPNGEKHSHGLFEHEHIVSPEQIQKKVASTQLTKMKIFMIGLGGGFIPCAEALALLVLAAKNNATLFGIVLVFAFSVGLAVTIILLGFLIISGKKRFANLFSKFSALQIALPLLTGVIITIYALSTLFSLLP
jgi:ABC-type nickel/cobalt efflux system permease component RcnA